jgi:hypothetical protein
MSALTIAVIIEGILLAVVLLFVVAVLRSHAELLRRLDVLESRGGESAARGAGGLGRGGSVREIVGKTLAGDAVKVSLGPGARPTLLAFLSSGCFACGPLWTGLRSPIVLPRDPRLVVVTKGPERERLARLLELAPAEVDLVMSTQAWEDFEIPATPHFVFVGSDDGILGRGSATSWEQIAGLLRDADDDGALHRARATEERAARAEQALAAAGIGAGHPSLYPSRRERQGGAEQRHE